MDRLTARQQEVFNLIKDNLDETGYPPTRAEIAQKLGFRSANAAEDHLRALARKGVIEMIPGASRGIRVVDHFSGIPIVGRVAAGEPILAEQILKITKKCRQAASTRTLTTFCAYRARVWLMWVLWMAIYWRYISSPPQKTSK